MTLIQNRSINKDARVMTKISKKSHCDLYLDLIMLKRELVRGIVISNTCVKLYRNWLINEVTRAMTKGEHTNKRTNVRTYVHTYGTDLYLLHNFVVRGDNNT